MNNTAHSLQYVGSYNDIKRAYPELDLNNDYYPSTWMYNNILLSELPDDCGTLVIQELPYISYDDCKWLDKFAYDRGFCVLFGTLVGDPQLQYIKDTQTTLLECGYSEVGHCPSSRDPRNTKYVYVKILQNTIRGYNSL